MTAERAALRRIARRLGERDEDEARELSEALLQLLELAAQPAPALEEGWPLFSGWHIIAPLYHASESLQQARTAGRQAPRRPSRAPGSQPSWQALTGAAELLDFLACALIEGAGSWRWPVLSATGALIAGGRDAALAAFVAACDELIRSYACRPAGAGSGSMPWHMVLTAMMAAIPQLAVVITPGSEPAEVLPAWLAELLHHAEQTRMKGATFAAHVALKLGLFGESPEEPTPAARDRVARSFRRRIARWERRHRQAAP